jgi:hypothetical protein
VSLTLNPSLHGDLICFEQFCSDSISSHLETSHPCREAPLEWMQLCLLSHGAQLGWEGPSSPFPVTEESITHQIIDRPAQGTEHKVTFIICSSLTPLTKCSQSLRSFLQTGRYPPSLLLFLPSSYRRHTVQGQGIRPATVGVRLYQRTDPLTGESLFRSNQPCSCLYSFKSILLITALRVPHCQGCFLISCDCLQSRDHSLHFLLVILNIPLRLLSGWEIPPWRPSAPALVTLRG